MSDVHSSTSASPSTVPFPPGYGGVPMRPILPQMLAGGEDSFTSHGSDPVKHANHLLHSFFSSPLLTLATLGGAAGVLGLIGVRYSHGFKARGAFDKLDHAFAKSLDNARQSGSPAAAQQLKRHYEHTLDLIVRNHKNLQHAHLLKLRPGEALNKSTLDSLVAHSKAIKEVEYAIRKNPHNRTALEHLAQRLENSMKTEVAFSLFSRRRSILEAQIRTIPSTSPEWQILRQDLHNLEAVCAEIEPPRVSYRTASQDLAHRYLCSQMDLLHSAQFVPLMRQGGVRRALREVYTRRQFNMASTLPVNERFWKSLGISDIAAKDLTQRSAHIQNLSWKMITAESSHAAQRQAAKERNRAINDFLPRIERNYPQMYTYDGSWGREPLDIHKALSRVDKGRVKYRARHNDSAIGYA